MNGVIRSGRCLRHASEKGFNIGAAIAKLNKGCDSCVSDCVYRQAVDKLVKLLGGLDVDNEAKRDPSGDGSTRNNAALLDEFLRSDKSRKNYAFGEGPCRVFSKWLACLVMVEFDEVSHGVSFD